MSLVNISVDTSRPGAARAAPRQDRSQACDCASAQPRRLAHVTVVVTRQLAGQTGLGVRETKDQLDITKAYAGNLRYRTIPERWLTLARDRSGEASAQGHGAIDAHSRMHS